MENELINLENSVAALIVRINELRDKNAQLNNTLLQTLKENADLQIRVEHTSSRISNLIQTMPKVEEVAPE